MKCCRLFSLLAAACIGFTAHGQEWQSLFDGQSLEGWKDNGEKPGCFTVEDGAIKVSGGRAHLFYAGPVAGGVFKDFEFRAKVKTEPNSNSGIYFHTQYQEKGWPAAGYECQVNNTHSDPRKTGGLYAVSDVMNTAPVPDNEWFDYRIQVEGKRIRVWINDTPTVDWTEPEGWTPPPNMSGRKLGQGTFALQGHDPKSTIRFKDLAVRVPDPAAGSGR